jgi:hypothetical protein
MNIAGSGAGSESRSVSQRYESADPNSYQNVTDPQHCIVENQAVFAIVSLVLNFSSTGTLQNLRIPGQ